MSEIHLNKFEKHDLVLRLLKEGKTYRDICHIAHTSPRDIKPIAKEYEKKVIGRLLFLLRVNNSNAVILRKIIPYVFSGGSILFIGYVLMNIFTNYPPRVIGISP
jgi:hypothetical protein